MAAVVSLCSSYLSWCYDNYSMKATQRMNFFLSSWFKGTALHGREEMTTEAWGSWSHRIYSQEGERQSLVLSSLMHSQMSARGMVPPALGVSLPRSTLIDMPTGLSAG